MRRHDDGLVGRYDTVCQLQIGVAQSGGCPGARTQHPNGSSRRETQPLSSGMCCPDADKEAVISATGPARVTVTITAHDPDGAMTCTDPATGQPVQLRGSSGIGGFAVVAASEEAEGDVTSQTEESRLISGTVESGVWQATLNIATVVVPGRWFVSVGAFDNNNNEVITEPSPIFSLRYNVSLSANAAPEPVRNGQYLKVSGSLRALDPDEGYVPAPAGVVVRIYFSAKRSGTWTYMGAAKTTTKGTYSRSFKAVRRLAGVRPRLR